MYSAGGLTQFQLMEDSAPATQTQKAVTDAITKNTLSMIGYAMHMLHSRPDALCFMCMSGKLDYCHFAAL